MGKNTETEGKWIHEFENLYILTYQTLYRHAKLIFGQDDKVKELLILTYVEAYQRREQITKEKDPLVWLLKRSDVLAESKMGATKEMLEASYAEERMQSKEAKKENWSKLDEASVLLEIEEHLGMEDETDSSESKSVFQTAVKGVFSLVLLAVAVLAVVVLVTGVQKVRNGVQKSILGIRSASGFSSDGGQPVLADAEPENKDICIQVGEKAVFLSKIGQVLYSVPIEQSNLHYESLNNPEIQKQTGWTYYLPCPERDDTQLPDVAPSLYHTLYRMRGDGKEIEIIAQEVDNYIIWEDRIYVSQYGHIQRINETDGFHRRKPGIYAECREDEIYLMDELGRTLETSSDGTYAYGDRIFKMSSNRLMDVQPTERKKGQSTYYLKPAGQTVALFRNRNGREELFEDNGKTIDSFCIVDDYVYYSAAVGVQSSGTHSSQLYRKSLVRDSEAEELGGRFDGRLYEMYYSERQHQIYAEYIPQSWNNYRGVIAAISLNGQMSLLDDKAQRSGVKTTGNDRLRFIMVQDGGVYCFWEDCHWVEGRKPSVLWQKVLVIPNNDRILPGE